MIRSLLSLTVALLWLACSALLIALPAAGLSLGVPARPAEASAAARLTPVMTDAGWSAGTGRRQRVGAVTWIDLKGSPEDVGAAHGALVSDLVAGLEGDLVATLVERVPSFAARHVQLGRGGVKKPPPGVPPRPEENRAI
jgi:hypothetical protein